MHPGPSGTRRTIGDIGDPKHARLVGKEVPVHQIAGWPQSLVTDRGPGGLATADALQACSFHQSFDALAPNMDAGISQFSMDARCAVDLPRGLMDGLDASAQIAIVSIG